MKPKYFQAEAPQRDRWMISYVDVLTILLIFFIAIAAHSFPALQATPSPKRAQLKTGAEASAPDDSDKNSSEPQVAMKNIQERLAKQGLELKLEPRGLVISLPQAVLFASGDDQVSREARPMIGKIAEVLRDVPNQVTLIGHADSVPIHNRRFKNNWELSAARGLRLLEMLSGGDYGIPESRLSVVSDGSFRPKDSNDTPDGRASNRRVELVILNDAGDQAH
jgi:chemotaxis protein MotB